jgi:glycogen operon protein
VRAPLAQAVWLCLFAGAGETRHAMARDGDDWTLTLPGDHAGVRYGYRAAGEWAPERGLWFDPAKLLVDPHAVELDRRFAYDPALSPLAWTRRRWCRKQWCPAPCRWCRRPRPSSRRAA